MSENNKADNIRFDYIVDGVLVERKAVDTQKDNERVKKYGIGIINMKKGDEW